MIDLDNWLSGRYRVASAVSPREAVSLSAAAGALQAELVAPDERRGGCDE